MDEDLTKALSNLPMFPLPQVVLLPGTHLPLHIFEPRYRRMLSDAMTTHRHLGVVQIRDLGDRDELGHPSLFSVMGIGKIVRHEALPGGRSNILLEGVARAAVHELPFEPPYRRARAVVLESIEQGVQSDELTSLISAATSFAGLVREKDPSFEFKLPKVADAEVLVNVIAQELLIDARDRQTALETLRVAERARRVIETLALQQLTLARSSGPLN